MAQAIIYVTQDGRDFYIHRKPDLSDHPTVWQYPGRVADFDLRAANIAREAFTDQARIADYAIEWPNPFGDS